MTQIHTMKGGGGLYIDVLSSMSSSRPIGPIIASVKNLNVSRVNHALLVNIIPSTMLVVTAVTYENLLNMS